MNPQKSFQFAGCARLQNSFTNWKYYLMPNTTQNTIFVVLLWGQQASLTCTFFFLTCSCCSFYIYLYHCWLLYICC